jgi:hypothetical protein
MTESSGASIAISFASIRKMAIGHLYQPCKVYGLMLLNTLMHPFCRYMLRHVDTAIVREN